MPGNPLATDAQGNFTLHTGKAIQATGRESGELIGKNYQDALSYNLPSRENIHRALTGEAFTDVVEGRLVRPSRSATRPSRCGGKDGRHDCLSLDITERRRAEDALRDSQRRLDLALEAGQMAPGPRPGPRHGDPISATRPDFRLRHPSTAWGAEIFFGHIVPEDRERIQRAFAEANTSGLLDFECNITRADGALRWIGVRPSHRDPMEHPSGCSA